MSEILGTLEQPIVVKTKLSKKESKEKTKKLQEELLVLKDEVDDIPPVDENILIEKPKRERSEKQKAVLAKANEMRKIKVAERKEQRQKEEAEQKKVTERKIINKAIKLKKKQIRHAKVLEESDSDSESEEEVIEKVIEKIKPKINKIPPPIQIPQRTIRFV